MTVLDRRLPPPPPNAAAAPTAVRRRMTLSTVLFLALMILWTLVSLGPLIWMVLDALRTNNQIFSSAIGLPSLSHASNFSQAWTQASLGHALLISVGVNVASVALAGVCSIGVGFALSRGGLPLRGALLTFFLLGLMIPTFSILIPLLTQFQAAGLTDSFSGLVLVYSGFSISLGVFLFKGAFDGIPKDYLEAAALDGASVPRMLMSVLLPMIRPTIATFSILTFLNGYNDFVFALTLISDQNKRTLPLALLQFSGQYGTQYNLVFAAVTISTVPALLAYLFLRRQIQTSLAMSGGVK